MKMKKTTKYYTYISIKYKHLVECTWIFMMRNKKMTIPIQFTLNLDKSLWKWMQILNIWINIYVKKKPNGDRMKYVEINSNE